MLTEGANWHAYWTTNRQAIYNVFYLEIVIVVNVQQTFFMIINICIYICECTLAVPLMLSAQRLKWNCSMLQWIWIYFHANYDEVMNMSVSFFL